MYRHLIIQLIFILALLSGCVTTGGGTRIDNLPMYGQPLIERPLELKQADEDFIEKAIDGYGSRETASKAWAAEADKFMSEGNIDYAMRRYNQSWLLDPDNYQPNWGFARVMVAKGQDEKSLKYFSKATELINDPYQRSALLSDFAVAYHNLAIAHPDNQAKKYQQNLYYNLANTYFEESTKADPG